MTIHVHQPVSPEACPALVLNADYRPLSYYPLSLWGWQDAIKAVFLDRVNIVVEYDTVVRSPTFEIPPAVRRVAEDLRQAVAPPRLHAVQRVPARPLHLPVLRRARGPDLRSRGAALERAARPPGKMSWPPARPAICARATRLPREVDMFPHQNPARPRCTTCTRTAGCFRPTICTRAGWTISIGTRNSSRRGSAPAGLLLAQAPIQAGLEMGQGLCAGRRSS